MKGFNINQDLYNGLISVGYYVAPGDKKIPSVTIPAESEYIEIITGGKVFFEVNNEEQVFSRGAVFWHLSGEGTIHRTPPDDPYRCLVLRFGVKSRIRMLPRVTQWHNEQSVIDFYQEALRCFHDDSYDRDVLGRYLYNRVFWEAYCYSLRKDVLEYPLPVRRAMAAIDNFPNSDFPIHDLADMIGISEPYLFALFNKYLNVSPHQYILNRRLQKAKALLAGGGKSIKEVAFECGFLNIESFYRAFKKNCGFTPAEYRKHHSPYALHQ